MSKNTRYTEFDHTPMRPVRKGFPGEVAFAEAWQRLMTTPTEDNVTPMLAQVLESSRFRPEPEDAKVLASVVTWFGTQAGSVFLDEAARLGGTNRYLMSWGARNLRVQWVNNGRRTLENILYGEAGESALTFRQHEVAECLMYWLGHSPDAQLFLQDCEAEVARQAKEASFVHFLSANCGLSDNQVVQAVHLAKAMTA
jgi:hypothetical protein